jgi:hypothetical protein
MAHPVTNQFPEDASIIARWEMTEVSGTRSDSAGSNDLTDNNTVGSAAGNFGLTCADFERDNSEYLSKADPSDLDLSTFSLSTWVNFETNSGINQVIFAKHDTSTSNRAFYCALENTSLNLYTYQDGSVGTFTGVGGAWGPSAGVWYHLLFTNSPPNTRAKIYINGSEAFSNSSMNGAVFDSSAPFIIGGALSSGSIFNTLDGMIGDTVIWDVELDGTEAGQVYGLYTAGGARKRFIIMI